ncbi:unnamed protein product [Lathyrus sativus]|nr:unnamed protein product [Lathyrus sativus]
MDDLEMHLQTLLIHILRQSYITGFEIVSAYDEDWPHTFAFISCMRNGAVEPFRVSLERMVPNDICFFPYEGHCQTCSFDVISLYSSLAACILRPPYEADHLGVYRRDLGAILDDFERRLVPQEYRQKPARVHWAYVEGYITWFYRVSHPIMTSCAPEGPPRLAYLEVL